MKELESSIGGVWILNGMAQGAQTIPSISTFRKLEEMVTCTHTVHIVGAIIASKSSTILSPSFSRRDRSFRGAYTFIHWLKVSRTK